MPLRLFAQECNHIVFEKDPCAADACADDVPSLCEFHRRGAVDFEEVSALLKIERSHAIPSE
ncbi:hypothetical protein WT01_00480 [Burkholderia cepacia]|nr:hypothetical protein WT01_00480 [Burkholderia cepacia]KVQ24403.1 hypothetical protein WK01_05830 [Burkholderia cepacia]